MVAMCGDLTFRHKQAAQGAFSVVGMFEKASMLAAPQHGLHSYPRSVSVSAENAGWLGQSQFPHPAPSGR
jgi:hypothetical protein